jgi:hypothetical protein
MIKHTSLRFLYGKEYNITEMTEGCGILFNLSFNTLIFVKFKHHESFPKHFNFKD